MATLTVRLTDNKADRLRAIAKNKNISVNKLIDELATYAIAEYDVQTRYQVRAARGIAARGLATLDMLDAYYDGGMPPAGFNADMSVLKKSDD